MSHHNPNSSLGRSYQPLTQTQKQVAAGIAAVAALITIGSISLTSYLIHQARRDRGEHEAERRRLKAIAETRRRLIKSGVKSKIHEPSIEVSRLFIYPVCGVGSSLSPSGSSSRSTTMPPTIPNMNGGAQQVDSVEFISNTAASLCGGGRGNRNIDDDYAASSSTPPLLSARHSRIAYNEEWAIFYKASRRLVTPEALPSMGRLSAHIQFADTAPSSARSKYSVSPPTNVASALVLQWRRSDDEGSDFNNKQDIGIETFVVPLEMQLNETEKDGDDLLEAFLVPPHQKSNATVTGAAAAASCMVQHCGEKVARWLSVRLFRLGSAGNSSFCDTNEAGEVFLGRIMYSSSSPSSPPPPPLRILSEESIAHAAEIIAEERRIALLAQREEAKALMYIIEGRRGGSRRTQHIGGGGGGGDAAGRNSNRLLSIASASSLRSTPRPSEDDMRRGMDDDDDDLVVVGRKAVPYAASSVGACSAALSSSFASSVSISASDGPNTAITIVNNSSGATAAVVAGECSGPPSTASSSPAIVSRESTAAAVTSSSSDSAEEGPESPSSTDERSSAPSQQQQHHYNNTCNTSEQQQQLNSGKACGSSSSSAFQQFTPPCTPFPSIDAELIALLRPHIVVRGGGLLLTPTPATNPTPTSAFIGGASSSALLSPRGLGCPSTASSSSCPPPTASAVASPQSMVSVSDIVGLWRHIQLGGALPGGVGSVAMWWAEAPATEEHAHGEEGSAVGDGGVIEAEVEEGSSLLLSKANDDEALRVFGLTATRLQRRDAEDERQRINAGKRRGEKHSNMTCSNNALIESLESRLRHQQRFYPQQVPCLSASSSSESSFSSPSLLVIRTHDPVWVIATHSHKSTINGGAHSTSSGTCINNGGNSSVAHQASSSSAFPHAVTVGATPPRKRGPVSCGGRGGGGGGGAQRRVGFGKEDIVILHDECDDEATAGEDNVNDNAGNSMGSSAGGEGAEPKKQKKGNTDETPSSSSSASTSLLPKSLTSFSLPSASVLTAVASAPLSYSSSAPSSASASAASLRRRMRREKERLRASERNEEMLCFFKNLKR